jgi:hypothetical protein
MTGSIVVQAAGGVTPAPTDTAPAPEKPHGDTAAVVLALLGVVMLVGTFVTNRRFEPARRIADDEGP